MSSLTIIVLLSAYLTLSLYLASKLVKSTFKSSYFLFTSFFKYLASVYSLNPFLILFATVSNLAADLIETDEIYYLKVAIPGISKEDVEIEVGDNDIVITTTFKPFIEELEDVEDAKVIASELTSGRCSKTVRFENSIDIDNIKAKYNAGIVLITLPKLIIPKQKITVE